MCGGNVGTLYIEFVVFELIASLCREKPINRWVGTVKLHEKLSFSCLNF